jgi:hypothetical protein
MAGTLVRKDTDPAATLGVPGEEHTYPQSWWRQLREPFRTAQPKAIAPAVAPMSPDRPQRGGSRRACG